MNKEVQLLGLSVIVFLFGIKGGGFFLPKSFGITVGIIAIVHTTYTILKKPDFKKEIKYLICAWLIVGAFGFVQLSHSLDTTIIQEADLMPAEGYKGIRDCEDGKRAATKDLKRGELRYIFGSYGGRQPLAENLKKYDIDIVIQTGLVGTANDCYNNIMYKEIQNKYGKDLFTREIK